MAEIFFTSDSHFGHANIIKYCDRPYADTKEMDADMIHQWNSVVGHNDIVYHLGDFCFSEHGKYFYALNGAEKHLISGNHDKSKNIATANWTSVHKAFDLKIGSQMFYLLHYPCLVWNKSHNGAYHLYGHVHGTLDKTSVFRGRSMDAGVDNIARIFGQYRPIHIDEVIDLLKDVDYRAKNVFDGE
jgi:calcineurin-like phosphoesterase family protein